MFYLKERADEAKLVHHFGFCHWKKKTEKKIDMIIYLFILGEIQWRAQGEEGGPGSLPL